MVQMKKAAVGRQQWQTACEAAGFAATGIHPIEAQHPLYFRKKRRSGVQKTMPGGGKWTNASWLFTAVIFSFENARAEG